MSDSNVVPFTGETRGEIPVAKIIAGAIEADLATIIIIGETKEGEEYFAASTGYAPEMNWLIDRCKKAILND